MPNHDRPTLRERWWMLVRTLTWRLSSWAARHETAHRVRRSIPRGTVVRVKLGQCGCADVGNVEGTWFVDRYNDEADDYKLARILEQEFSSLSMGEATYVCRKAIEVVKS